MQITELTQIDVSSLVLDLDNPRMYHHGIGGDGEVKLSDAEIEEDITNNDTNLPELIRSIQAEGVREAIYVVPVDGDKYRVVEGNRRTVVMRHLVRISYVNEGKPHLDFTKIPAKIIPEGTEEKEIYKSKVIWQTGKSVWGAFNVATAVYRMRHEFLMSPEDISDVMQKPVRDVKEMLRAYDTFNEYSITSGDRHTSRFSYFSKECPTPVRTWVHESPENKNDYFTWINPNSENHRLRSVATRGGLRDFKDVVKEERAIAAFKANPEMTVEDAVRIVDEGDFERGRAWLKQIEKVSIGLNGLDVEEVERLEEENYRPKLVALKRAIDNILEDF